MATYLKLVTEFVPTFERFELMHIPQSKNSHANAPSKLASSKDSDLLKLVLVEYLSRLSTSKRG